ncbi:type II toxin-antitoxin system PemK/MazF family toxin [Burkholderia ubonensis]|uniref:type II toxin-antitoxin system PemK/MazF family toxin n=1 Tax=Burkholderia ubonensis TaxID=101571 RepID=UPI0012FA65A0
MSSANANRKPVAGHVPNVGDVIWFDGGPTEGHEQDYYRPWICISDQRFNDASGMVACVPCTTTVKGNQWEIPIEGLPQPTASLWTQPRTIDWRARGAEYFGETVSQDVLGRIRLRIARLYGIPTLK